jgi:MmyB-like transcription regulator ligand binding domain
MPNRGSELTASPMGSDDERDHVRRFIFLDPAAREFDVEWERVAGDTVVLQRAEAGRNPYDRALDSPASR